MTFDPLKEALDDMVLFGACPATSTEFNGECMPCMLEAGHIEAHTDGCVTWNDPWGELDADQHRIAE